MKRIILFIAAICLLLTSCGKEPEFEPMTQEDLSTVYTDWSKLMPYEDQSLYNYYLPRSKDGLLQPQDDYGILLPYVGASDTSYYGNFRKVGLVTADGLVVTEPVYEFATYFGNFMVLAQKELNINKINALGNYYSQTINYHTLAAPDGSWAMEYGYHYPLISISDDLLVLGLDDQSIIAVNSDGKIVSDFPATLFISYFGEDFRWDDLMWDKDDGIVCFERRNMEDRGKLYLDFINDIVLNGPPEGFEPEEEYGYVKGPVPDVTGYYNIVEAPDRITGKMYYMGYNGGMADLLDETGELVFEDCYYYFDVADGLIGAIRDDHFCYYSIETGELIFKYPIRSNLD